MSDIKERIDPLILERAPWMARGDLKHRVGRRLMEKLLGYDDFIDLARLMEPLDGHRVMDRAAGMIAHRIDATGLEHVPRSGPALIVATHPTGIADGLILWWLLTTRRPDLYFFANTDITRAIPQLAPIMVPVEWQEHKRSRAAARETLAATRRAVDEGRLGVIFPSGRLMKRVGLTLNERPWMPSAASMARKFDLPVIPVSIRARNSALFYALDALHPTLRDVTLFHEMLNKSRTRFRVNAGPPIPAADIPANAEEGIAFLRDKALELRGGPPAWPGPRPVRPPAPRPVAASRPRKAPARA